ncbi:MAG: hypothetical protein M3P98_01435 [bacterium]|nr:hypothetical protein [bacterium]
MKKQYILATAIFAGATIWFIPQRAGLDVPTTPRLDQPMQAEVIAPLKKIENPKPTPQPKTLTVKPSDVAVEDRAGRIDAYYAKRKMPLEGYGQKMVEEADKNGIDWRLLPAISIKESSGGLHMCRNNPFGWASCKLQFGSVDEAIETVARNLGGNNPKTHAYYKGDTYAKLWSYNGTVESLYPARVIAIMEKI